MAGRCSSALRGTPRAGTRPGMWAAYIALIVIAGVSFGFGLPPVGIASLVVLIGLAGFAVLGAAGRARDRRVHRGGPADAAPSSAEPSYQPAHDPSRTGS